MLYVSAMLQPPHCGVRVCGARPRLFREKGSSVKAEQVVTSAPSASASIHTLFIQIISEKHFELDYSFVFVQMMDFLLV